MPKYRNNGEFFQTLTIGGKRTHVRPGDVFFSDRELDLKIYDALVRVSDDAVAKQPIVRSQPSIPVNSESNKKLEEQINSLKAIVGTLITQASVDEKINKAKEEILEQTPQVEPAEIDSMVGKVKELEELCKILKENKEMIDLVGKVNILTSQMNDVERRQLILKDAITKVSTALQSVEQEVYLNNNVVVIDDEEKI